MVDTRTTSYSSSPSHQQRHKTQNHTWSLYRLTPRLSCGARAPQRLRPRPPARGQLQPVVRPDVDYGRFEISEEPRSDRWYLAPQVREMVCGTARAEDPEAHTA